MRQFALARKNMVQNQILPSQVTNKRLLSALENTPKHIFLPPEWQSVAYADARLPVGMGRTLLQPETLAKMLQACQINEVDKILEIGCATGYTTALLAQMGAEVFALDNVHDFIVQTGNNLPHLKLTNVSVIAAELLAGYPAAAPYDVIFINGKLNSGSFSGASNLLHSLHNQLAEGGRMLLVEDCQGAISKAVLYLKKNAVVSKIELFTAYAEQLI